MKPTPKTFLIVIVLVALMGLLAETISAQALSKDDLDRALRAAVKLGILGPDDEVMGSCSGTILNKQGYILTNFHCVGQTDIYGADEEMGLSHGDLYNPDGKLLVAVNETTKKPPVPTYVAQFVAGNPDQDVAVIKIIAYMDAKKKLPETLPVVPNVLIDSDAVEIGDEVNVIGYPGVGGATVTFTDGKIAGFEEDEKDDDELTDWFKTDALINGGNSGGSAVNDKGQVVGIPSAKLVSEADMMYFIKPVNQAIPIIERALKAGDTGGDVDTNKGGGGDTEVPKGKNIGLITFGTAFEDDGLVDEGTSFESGITEIHAAVPYQDMANKTLWSYAWFYEGQESLTETDLKWEWDKTGVLDLWIGLEDGLPDGEYNLQVSVKGKLAQEAGFVIGDAEPEDKPEKPPEDDGEKADEGVIVTGSIIDANTQKPIEGAIIVFLKPGKTVDDFDNADDVNDVILSVGKTDEDGLFTIDIPLPRGEVYSVLVGKKGYERIAMDDAFEVADDDPSLIELEPIELEK